MIERKIKRYTYIRIGKYIEIEIWKDIHAIISKSTPAIMMEGSGSLCSRIMGEGRCPRSI